MKWPWQKDAEVRQASYTDELVAWAQRRATAQQPALATATGALETCSMMMARAFAGASVVTDSPTVMGALTPECMGLIGRALVRKGEVIFVISTEGGLQLLPAVSTDVDGLADPSTWTYRATLTGPSYTHTWDNLPASDILHFRWAVDPLEPWRGISPMQASRLTGRAAAELLDALGDEMAGPRTNMLATPVDGDSDTLAKFRSDIATAKGKVLLLESGDFGGAPGGGEVVLKPERLGANPPMALAELYKLTSADIYNACGIPHSLTVESPGVSQREALRRFAYLSVEPCLKMIASECTSKLGVPVSFDLTAIRAGDLAGTARAFGILVSNGIPVPQALTLTHLLTDG